MDMRTQIWPRSPRINVATHKNQFCCLSWRSFFAECGSKSTLMSGGAGGCAQGPVHCCWLYICLALLVAVKVQPRSTGIPAFFFGAVGLHAFCLPSLHTPHTYIYIIKPIRLDLCGVQSPCISLHTCISLHILDLQLILKFSLRDFWLTNSRKKKFELKKNVRIKI